MASKLWSPAITNPSPRSSVWNASPSSTPSPTTSATSRWSSHAPPTTKGDGRRSTTSPPRSAEARAHRLHRSGARRPPPHRPARQRAACSSGYALLRCRARKRAKPGDDRNGLPEGQLARRNLGVVCTQPTPGSSRFTSSGSTAPASTARPTPRRFDCMSGADQPDVAAVGPHPPAPRPHHRHRPRASAGACARPSPTGSPTPSSRLDAAVDPLTVATLDAASAFDLWNSSRPVA